MYMRLCCEIPYVHKQGVAHPFPHLRAGCLLASQRSAFCAPKGLRNTCTSGLKSQSPRLGSTVTKDFSAEPVLVRKL